VLEDVKTALTKKFGDEILFSLTDAARRASNAYPTGLMSLDYALGVGGLPPGRIIEVYGNEGSGKTSVCLKMIAACQAFFKMYFEGDAGCAFIDVENALDPAWAELNGVDLDELLISQPDSAEQALDVVEALILTDKIKLIVVDSVAALTPQAELDGTMEDNTIALQARLMSKALRKLKGIVSSHECDIVFINQIREKVGVLYGNPETTPGGRALRFYASIRIQVRKGDPITQGKVQIGHEVNAKIVKNKVAPPYKLATFEIYYDHGVDTARDIFNVAQILGIITSKGAWFYYGDLKWNGKNPVVEDIRNKEELRMAVSTDITVAMKEPVLKELAVNAKS
jgi:recombination protein RecA